MSVQYKREFAPEIFEDIGPLLIKHYKEIAHYQDIELKPDWQAYAQLEECKILRVFTVRDEAKNNELIGYAIYFVRKNIHYSDSLQAVQDILFVDPSRRGIGLAFMKWCDKQLKAEHVQVVYHHVKKSHDFGPLLARQGYTLVDYIYGKRLDL